MSKLIVNEIEKYDAGQLTITTGTDVSIGSDLTVGGALAGTLSTAAQPNVTSVGTLSSLAVSGNLTVDTDTLFVDAANNRVGIGTSSPAVALDVKRTQTGSTEGAYPSIQSLNQETGATSLSSLDTISDNGGIHVQVAAVKLGGASYGRFGTLTNHDVRIFTNSTEKARFLAGGGLTFNGDTAAANALDDYEEGTWTPVVKGNATEGTYEIATQFSTYTKIGRLVTLNSRITLDNPITGGGSGSLIIVGLPFAKGTNRTSVGAVFLDGVNYTSDFVSITFTSSVSSTSTLNLLETTDNSSFDTVPISAVSASSGIYFSISYEV